MLRDETRIGAHDRAWTRAGRLAMAASLLGVTAAVGMLRGPARGAEDGAPTAAGAGAETTAGRTAASSLPPLYVRQGADGVVVIRPAAVARHLERGRLKPFLDLVVGGDSSQLTRWAKSDTTRPGFVRLRAEDLEWITVSFSFGRTKDKKQGDLHTVRTNTPAFRTVAPFDWLAFLRQWRLEFTEVREGGHVYYRIGGPLKAMLGRSPCAYLPDDRTLVTDEEDVIRDLVGQPAPSLPAYLRGTDWERACRGLLAVALNNRDGALTKDYDLGRPDDAMVLPLFKGVDRWLFSADDADALVLRAAAACTGGDASAAVARSIEALVKQGRDMAAQAAPEVKPGDVQELTFRMVQTLMDNVRVEHTDRSVGVRTDRFGTLADLASVIKAEVEAEMKANGPGPAQERSKP